MYKLHNLIYKFATFCNIQQIIEYYNERERVDKYQPADDIAIELENINMFSEGKTIIDDFDYKFKKNRTYGILGPSGAGKSVLVDHFNGLTKSKQGNIYLFNGEKIVFYKKKIKNYREIRRNVGMVLQFPEYQLFQETVLGDVCYGLKMLGMSSEEATRKAKAKLIDLDMKEDFFKSNPLLLSGGQKRKVALAGILAIDPEIIIFDEPSIGLDPQSEEKVSEIIKKLKQEKKTVIIISHNIDLVLGVADELLILDEGKFITSGDPYAIFKKFQWKIGLPKIIYFVQKLCEKNPKFSFLWKVKPKNIDELSVAISNVVKNKNHDTTWNTINTEIDLTVEKKPRYVLKPGDREKHIKAKDVLVNSHTTNWIEKTDLLIPEQTIDDENVETQETIEF